MWNLTVPIHGQHSDLIQYKLYYAYHLLKDIYKLILLIMFFHLCVCMPVCMGEQCGGQKTDNLLKLTLFFQPHDPWRLNSNCQTWLQVPIPTKLWMAQEIVSKNFLRTRKDCQRTIRLVLSLSFNSSWWLAVFDLRHSYITNFWKIAVCFETIKAKNKPWMSQKSYLKFFSFRRYSDLAW